MKNSWNPVVLALEKGETMAFGDIQKNKHPVSQRDVHLG